ncbi:MAG: hypothetical protein IJA62_03170 [Ruminococcus sp.]|nr:hypothetical protein [Ruminococcus sp.]
MKKAFALIMVLVMVLSLAACGGKTEEEALTLVGQWEYEGGGYVYTFNEDGTGTYSFAGTDMKFTYEDKGTSFSLLYDGNTDATDFEYVIDGKTLTVTDSFGEPVVYNRK